MLNILIQKINVVHKTKNIFKRENVVIEIHTHAFVFSIKDCLENRLPNASRKTFSIFENTPIHIYLCTCIHPYLHSCMCWYKNIYNVLCAQTPMYVCMYIFRYISAG